MHVLICGKENMLCDQLIRRLKKEQHEIYLLDGQSREANAENAPGVFQHYHFTYTSDGAVKAISSAAPECMIILGSCDSLYTWRKQEKEAIDFTVNLTSLLMGAQQAKVQRVIYLSSIDVYETNVEEDITLDTLPQADTPRLSAYGRAEDICKSFRDAGMEITILRLPEVYGGYDQNAPANVCLRMVLECLLDGIIHCTPNMRHSVIYQADAADAVCKVLETPSEILLPVYQIRGYQVSEDELAVTMQNEKWNDSAVVERIEGGITAYPPDRITVSHEERLHFRMKYNLIEGLELLYKDCLRYHKNAQRKKRENSGIITVIETVALAVLVHLVSVFMHDTWVGDHLNLYIIYVALIGCAYGTDHGLFAALLASVGSLFLQLQDNEIMELLASYGFFLEFLELIIIGVLCGFMHDKFKRRNNTLTEENRYLDSELTDITRINDGNMYVKGVYAKRLTNYENSLAKIYEMTSRLDFMVPQKVVFQAVRVVTDLMEIEDAAVYVANPQSSYFRLAARTSRRAASCGKSLHYCEEAFLYEALERGEVYQNRTMEEGRPVYAAAVRSEGQIIALILTWTDNINKINLYETNLLALLCRLIEKSMLRAAAYDEAYRRDNYLPGTNIMNDDAFHGILEVYEDGLQQGLLEYAYIIVDLCGQEMTAVQKMVRYTDVLGLVNGRIHIILTNSNREDAFFVVNRLVNGGFQSEIMKYGQEPEESVQDQDE